MRAAGRALTLSISLVLCGAAAGCAPQQDGNLVGTSTGPRPRSESPAPPKPKSVAWPRYDEVRGWQPVTETALHSQGHAGGRYDVLIRVSPAARETYETLAQGVTLPQGTLIAAFHQSRTDQRPGPVFVMEKKGSWRFRVLRANGFTQPEARTELCQRCHAEAVADSVFGLPATQAEQPGPSN